MAVNKTALPSEGSPKSLISLIPAKLIREADAYLRVIRSLSGHQRDTSPAKLLIIECGKMPRGSSDLYSANRSRWLEACFAD